MLSEVFPVNKCSGLNICGSLTYRGVYGIGGSRLIELVAYRVTKLLNSVLSTPYL